MDCTYQPNVKFEYWSGDKNHVYHPEFLISGHIVEVKGEQFFKFDHNLGQEVMICPVWMKNHVSLEKYEDLCKVAEAKHQCMLANKVIILRKSHIKNLSVSMFV